MTARVCVVVLNWHRPDLTAKCLDHLARQEGVTLDTLVVDNGSADPSRITEVCAGRSRLELLPENLGFAGGMNHGISLAGDAPYVWLLNNDAFPAPDCLGRLVAAMEAAADLHAVTPVLTNPDGTSQLLGAKLDLGTGAQEPLYAVPRTSAPGVSLIGAALLVRSETLRRVGAFDERFFAYREDDDLCFRITAAGGFLGAVLGAHCAHLGGASSGVLGGYLHARNGWHLLRRYAPGGRRRLALRYLATVVRDAGNVGDRPQLAAAKLAGVRAGFAGRYGPPPSAIPRRGLLSRIALRQPWRTANFLDWLARLV